MVLAQKHKYRSVKQKRETRIKPKRLQSTNLKTMEARIYNGEKTAPSIIGLGKLDSYMLRNEIKMLPNTIHKKKLKMD